MDHCTGIAFISMFSAVAGALAVPSCAPGFPDALLSEGGACATFHCRSRLPRARSLLFLRIQGELNLSFVTLTFNQDGAKNRQVVTPALFCTETSSLRRRLKSACSLPRCHFSLCTNRPGCSAVCKELC